MKSHDLAIARAEPSQESLCTTVLETDPDYCLITHTFTGDYAKVLVVLCVADRLLQTMEALCNTFARRIWETGRSDLHGEFQRI